MSQDNDRRRHSRIASGIAARLKSPTGKVYTGYSRDVSHSGAYICCDNPIFISSTKECLLKLIFKEGSGVREVGFRCRCIRTSEEGFAVEFIAIRKEDASYFANKLEELSGSAQTIRNEYNKCPYPPTDDDVE